jgi:hypothetical protein
VNKQCIRGLCKQKERPENATKSKWAFCSKQSAIPQTEDEACAYFMDSKKSGRAVSTDRGPGRL